MRKWMAALAALTLAGCAHGPQPSATPMQVRIAADNPVRGMDAAALRKLQLAAPQMLFWSRDERFANFRQMDKLFPGTTAPAAARVRDLPPGRPLEGLGDIELDALMASQGLVGLMVVQDGRVRLEKYARGFGPDQRWTSFSVAKSLTSTLAGQALAEGKIHSLDDPVTRYVPELAGSAYEGVTVRQILTMSSGVKWDENYADPNSDVARMFSEPFAAGQDPMLNFLRKLPREAEPGTKWVYKTGETNLIGTIVQRATGMVLTDYARTKLIPAAGFEKPLFWLIDPTGTNVGGCCLSLTLRDYARFGLLALEGGKGVTGADWFADATRDHYNVGVPGFGYGYQWWTYPEHRWGGQGIFGQAITINPARNVVVVQLGNWPRASDRAMRMTQLALMARIEMALSPQSLPGKP